MLPKSLGGIIQRLRLAREIRQITLGEVAQNIGYAVSTLSNIEQGRDRPSEALINAYADLLEIDRQWLQTGKGPMFRENSPTAKLWIEVWLANARRRLKNLRAQAEANLEEAHRLEESIRPVDAALKLVNSGTHALNFRLTDVSPEYKDRELQARLPELIEAVKQLTEQRRGKKTELATFLGVPLPRVSQWLHGRKRPGGETTLRLLQWVEQQEAQQQERPGSVATESGPKAQPESKSNEEKQDWPNPK